MSSQPGVAPYVPDYASYNWTGAPANYAQLATNDIGGDSSMFYYYFLLALYGTMILTASFQERKM